MNKWRTAKWMRRMSDRNEAYLRSGSRSNRSDRQFAFSRSSYSPTLCRHYAHTTRLFMFIYKIMSKLNTKVIFLEQVASRMLRFFGNVVQHNVLEMVVIHGKSAKPGQAHTHWWSGEEARHNKDYSSLSAAAWLTDKEASTATNISPTSTVLH